MSISAISGNTGAFAMQQMQQMQPKSPTEKFQEDDTNNDGVLDVTEFSAVAQKMSEMSGEDIDVEALMAEYDSDGDGGLNQDEMMSLMETMRPPMGGGPGGPPPMGGMSGVEETESTEETLLDYLNQESEEEENSYINQALSEYLKSAAYEGTGSTFQADA